MPEAAFSKGAYYHKTIRAKRFLFMFLLSGEKAKI